MSIPRVRCTKPEDIIPSFVLVETIAIEKRFKSEGRGGERENRAAFSKDRWWPYDILLLRRVYVFALKLILPGSWATCPGNSIGNRSSFVFHRYLVDFRPDGEKEGEGERKKREGRERKRRKKNWDLVKGV